MNPIHQKKELLRQIQNNLYQDLAVIVITLILGIVITIMLWSKEDDTTLLIVSGLWWAFVITGIIHRGRLKKQRIALEEQLRSLEEEHFL